MRLIMTHVDVEQIADFNSVLNAAKLVEAAEEEIEESIKALSGKRSELDAQLTELRCSLPDFNVIHDNSRNLSRMVGKASELALELSGKIRQLDLVKNRVVDCVSKLDDIISLKTCASSAEMALREERFEDAASYVNTFLKTRRSVIDLTGKITSDTQTQNAVSVLEKCRGKLSTIIEQKFAEAARMHDTAAIERFCKIFPMIGKHEEGLQHFGDYLCVTIRQKCNGFLSLTEVSDETEQNTAYINVVTEIFEYIAETVRDNQSYLETYFGAGHLLNLIKLIQTECDTLIRRVIDGFRTKHRLPELFRLIQPSAVSAGKVSQLNLLNASGSSNPATISSGASSTEQLQMERILSLEPILSEIVLLNTRCELYMRFMRRRVTADLNSATLDSSDLEVKLQNANTLFNQCQTVRQMQDLIGGYIHLEGYYLRAMVSKAVGSDEVDDNTKTLRFADDVFFVLKNCLSRALTSGSVDAICAMLNHSRAVLLDVLVTDTLTTRIRAGFPSGWMQDAYNYMQSSVSAVNPGVSGSSALTGAASVGLSAVTSVSGNAARLQFLITQNTVEACLVNLDTLCSQFERNLTTLFDSPQEANIRKLRACLTELKQSVSEQLQHLLDNGIDQLTSSVIRTQVKTVLQPFTSMSYELTEDDLDVNGANDPWMENCIAELDQFLKPFRTILSQGNIDRIVCVLTTELARRIEQLIQRKAYNRFGAIQLEKELRCLFAYLTSITYAALRDLFTRLLQICNLLNLDKVDEVTFYWNSATWRLTPNEVRRILSLRTEFPTDEIRRLKL